MPARAIVAHRLPGRVRVRIPSRRRDGRFFDAVAQKLKEHPDVHEVTTNPHTGSLLIRHSGNADDILSLAFDFFELSGQPEATQRLRAAARRSGFSLPDILDGTAVITAALGVYQVARRDHLGAATENFWAAFGSYRLLNSSGLAVVFAGIGIVQLLRGHVLGSATSLIYYSLLAHQMADVQRKIDAAGSRRTAAWRRTGDPARAGRSGKV